MGEVASFLAIATPLVLGFAALVALLFFKELRFRACVVFIASFIALIAVLVSGLGESVDDPGLASLAGAGWVAVSITLLVGFFYGAIRFLFFSGRRGRGFLIALSSFIVAVSLVVIAAGRHEPDPEKVAEDRRKGFHCLSDWDGTHREFLREVKGRLRDPDSFEHIKTRVTPADEDGWHSIAMTYRARNGFGGMTVGVARGKYSNGYCGHFVIAVQ